MAENKELPSHDSEGNQTDGDSLPKRFLKVLGASIGAGTAAGAAAVGGMALDQGLSPSETHRLIKEISRLEGMKAPTQYRDPRNSGWKPLRPLKDKTAIRASRLSNKGNLGDFLDNLKSFYIPEDHKVFLPSKKPLQSIVAHELGHASSKGPGLFNDLRKANMKHLYPRSKLWSGLPAWALLSEKEEIRDLAAPVSLALASPVLAEEAIASGKALKNLYKLRGAKAALRGAPGLAGAFATYASVPGGVWLGNKWITGKNKAAKTQKDEESLRMSKAASNAFWQGFEKASSEEQPAKRSNAAFAAQVGAATTGALTAHGVASDVLRENKDFKRVKSSKSTADLVKKMKPGDIVFSRFVEPRHTKDKELLQKLKRLKGVLAVGGGAEHYHASLYVGRGNTMEHPGQIHRAGIHSAHAQLGRGHNSIVFRPKVSKRVKEQAVSRARQLKGRAYGTNMEIFQKGVRNLLNPMAGVGKRRAKTLKGNVLCTDVITHAYPSLFPDKDSTINQMSRHPKMEMVARLTKNKSKPKGWESVLAKGVHPILKNLKWGVGAGLLTAGGLKVKQSLGKGKKEEV